MGDEPRRSGRATKGINNKNQEIPEPLEAKPVKAKGKGSKASAAPPASNAPTPEEDEEDAIIRCICGIQEDDGGRVMICCDNCSAWQHNDCMGITEEEDKLPDQYFCEQCKPEDHKELLVAIQRGEKPWEEAARQREEAKRKTKRKGGRKSKSGRPSKGDETVKVDDGARVVQTDVASMIMSTPPQSETNKRKFESVAPAENLELSSKPKKVKETPAEDENQQSERRKSSTVKDSRRTSALIATRDVSPVARSLADLQNDNRKKIANALRAKLEKQIRELSKLKSYRIPDNHTPITLAEEIALSVEHALYTNLYRETQDFSGPYKSQFSTILFNLGQNSSLLLRLLTGQLTADELSKMQSDDMASEELQQKMASMKEEADKQSILIQDAVQGPRVRRTHKGEELVEDLSNATGNDLTMAAPPLPQRVNDTVENLQSIQSPTVILGPQDTGSDAGLDTGLSKDPKPILTEIPRTGSSSAHDRRLSSNFDIQTVWSSVQSPDHEQPRTTFPAIARPYVRSSSQSAIASNNHDEEIDRLLNDDANESPPYSPTDYSGDPAVTWRGLVDMPGVADESVAKFKAISYHVAGSDLANRRTFSAIFPTNLVLHGRIDHKRADSYLTSLSSARSTDVTVHTLTTATDEPIAKDQFSRLFEYFFSRERYGVVGEQLHRDGVRDIYLVPLEAGLGEMPQFLQRLDFNNIEQPRPQRMLLVVFVLKWEDGSASTQENHGPAEGIATMNPSVSVSLNSGQTITSKAHAAMSPIISSQQRVASTALPFGTLFPGNPYTPSFSPNLQQVSTPASSATDLAKGILGQLFHCPTAQTIVTTQPDIPLESLRNLKQILETYPDTRDDMKSFSFHLNEQNGVGA